MICNSKCYCGKKCQVNHNIVAQICSCDGSHNLCKNKCSKCLIQKCYFVANHTSIYGGCSCHECNVKFSNLIKSYD